MNVDHWINKYGGKKICGWKLSPHNLFRRRGVGCWTFHSVWLTPNNKLYDVTRDPEYTDKEFITFWPDINRNVDLLEGTFYNNIVVFESAKSTRPFSVATKTKIRRGEIYWASHDASIIRHHSQHSGICRWLMGRYKNNIRRLEREYNLRVVEGKITPSHQLPNANNNLMLDYSLL